MKRLGAILVLLAILPMKGSGLSAMQTPEPAQPIEEAIRIIRNYLADPYQQIVKEAVNKITNLTDRAEFEKALVTQHLPHPSDAQRKFASEVIFVSVTYERLETFLAEQRPGSAANRNLQDKDWTWFILARHPKQSEPTIAIRLMRDGRVIELYRQY